MAIAPQSLSDFYGDHLSPKMFGAQGDTVQGADGAIASGAHLLTSAGASFKADDVGKSIWIQGAAAGGLVTTITAVPSPTTVTLTDAASAAASGSLYRYGTDDTAAFTRCLAAKVSLFIPDGYYFVQGNQLRIQRSGLQISGAGIFRTTVFCPSGALFRNYTTGDTDFANNEVDTFFDLTVEDLKLQGGVTLPDDYTVNPTASGRSKTLTTDNLNSGFRCKLSARNLFRKVAFENFHRGLFVLAGEISSLWHCSFLQCEVGQYLTTGFTWGNGSFKITTHTSEKAEYRECWYGVWSDATVDSSLFREDVFQLVNTCLYLSNSNGVKLLSTYMEADYEGLVIDGGYAGTIVCDHFDYEGPGGGGYAIHILVSCGPFANVQVMNLPTPILGGGGVHVGTGKASIDQPQTPLTQPQLCCTSLHNTGLWPDPGFSRKFIPGTNPGSLPSGLVGLTWSVDDEGNNVLNIAGAGGTINYAGLLLGIYPTLFDGPLRISFEYQYSGSNPYIQPLGMVLFDGTENLPIAPVVSPSTDWVKVDAFAANNAGLPGAPLQGNFDGTVKIRKLYISAGFAPSSYYVPEPGQGFILTAAPTWGTWRQGDFARNAQPAGAGDPYGWFCIVGGTPGTWRPIASSDPTLPIPIQVSGADVYGGSGAPAFAANPGSIYVNSGGGANNTIWIKERDTGSTGWVPYGAPSGGGGGGGGAVSSVFGRSGAVVATAGDYSFSAITGTLGIAQGGTGATTAALARTALSVLQSGAAIPVQGTAATIYAGSGNPGASGSGLTGAALGSVFLNTGGGGSNTIWVKEGTAGSANNGWVPK